MKHLLLLVAIAACTSSYAQKKYDYSLFNKLTLVEGTNNVVATIEHHSKTGMSVERNSSLLFINTQTGEATPVTLPSGGSIHSFEQVKIDSLGINLILLVTKTVDLDEKKGIDWEDPQQIIAIPPDGKNPVQLTEDNFFPQTWMIVRKTGRIVITGHYDSNNNGKYDKQDKTEISIFDLGTLKLVSKI